MLSEVPRGIETALDLRAESPAVADAENEADEQIETETMLRIGQKFTRLRGI